MKEVLKKLFLAIFITGVLQAAVVSGADLTVNDNLAGIVCNQTLSLAEAAQFAMDGTAMRNLTDGEKNQISGVTWVAFPPDPNCSGAIWRAAANGGVGSNFADNIFFTNAVTQINDPVFLGRNDDIDGLKPNGTKVILDGTGIINRHGINYSDPSTLPTGSQIRNLVIRNYPLCGIRLHRADGAILEGLEIFNNGLHGIMLDNNPGATKNNRNVRIGGDQPQHRNLIYGNASDGIAIIALANSDRFPNQGINILNNYIGTSNGTSDNGNNGNGIYLENAFGVIIGDATGATRNIISGNNGDGVKIIGEKAVSNEVIGNFIGTNSTGGAALGNSLSGISLLAGAGFSADFISSGANRIGKPGLGNVISANNFGIFIADNNTSNNWIQSNSIGTNVGGNTDLGNTLDGILVGGGTFDNRVGDVGANEGNLLAFNRRGIFADGGIRNSFRRNRIFSNDQLGIDLAPVGVTPNDAGDGDTGPNGLLNFPVITYVNAQNSSVSIEGTYNSAPNQTYTLEFFGNTTVDPTGNGEGRNFLGQTIVTTDGSGNASFNVNFPVNIANTGTWVTATATDSNNNTSEYSLARNICADLRVSPIGFVANASGGASSFIVFQSVGCGGYTPVPNVSWLNVTSSSGGTVNFTAAANSGAQRTGAIVVNYNNGQFATAVNFNVTQLANGCSYSLSPTNVNFSTFGGLTSFNVSTSAGCSWMATSNASWISITSGTSGTGNGTVSISIPINSGPPRTGTITVAGQTYTVNQAGCSYTLSQTSINLGTLNQTFAFTVTPSSSGCSWTVTSNDSWITIQGSSTRLGNGTVIFTADSSQAQSRTGTISVAGQTFTVNQTPSCLYGFTPSQQTIPASGGNGSFQITAPAGCGWRFAGAQDAWVTVTSALVGIGNGTITFTVPSHQGDQRTTIFPFASIAISVTQLSNCTFDTSITSASFPVNGGNGSFNVTNAVPCNWFVVGAPGWITITSPFSNSGNQTVTFTVAPNTTGATRNGTIRIHRPDTSVIREINISQSGAAPIFDFDGDGKTDISIFRPSNGQWWYLRSSDGGNRVYQFGQATDKLAPGDFTGDGKTDIAFFRPSNGTWFILRSEDDSFFSFPFGTNGDIPAPADYDGDGKTDPAIFRPSTATWFISRSSDGGTSIFGFGLNGDKPVVADYDGDGKADVAIFRPSDGTWWYQRSSDGQTKVYRFGEATDKPVSGDYTGDGKADIAFFRPATGEWFILRSEDDSFFSFPFGANGDIPAPADYDGDGRFDPTVFRPSNATWFINRTQSGLLIVGFGFSTDLPVPNASVP